MRKIKKDEIKDIIYEIMVFIDDFCQKNDIKYFLSYGTCLGAVRHKDFIPWDDDADLMMDRENYNKFINLMQNNNSSFKVLDCYNRPDYYYPFAKVVDTRTVLKENFFKKIKDYGVYVDIFPIDGLPATEEARKEFVSFARSERHNLCVYAANFFMKTFGFFLPQIKSSSLNRKAKHFDDVCSQFPLNNSEYVCTTVWGPILFPKYVLDEIALADFKDKKFPIPKEYDTYLTYLYGDYMTLPPKNKRSSHHHFRCYYKK